MLKISYSSLWVTRLKATERHLPYGPHSVTRHDPTQVNAPCLNSIHRGRYIDLPTPKG